MADTTIRGSADSAATGLASETQIGSRGRGSGPTPRRHGGRRSASSAAASWLQAFFRRKPPTTVLFSFSNRPSLSFASSPTPPSFLPTTPRPKARLVEPVPDGSRPEAADLTNTLPNSRPFRCPQFPTTITYRHEVANTPSTLTYTVGRATRTRLTNRPIHPPLHCQCTFEQPSANRNRSSHSASHRLANAHTHTHSSDTHTHTHPTSTLMPTETPIADRKFVACQPHRHHAQAPDLK